ncbi:hypothetical protein JCM10450v2_002131 [Rhodotorula kratochvilovae]
MYGRTEPTKALSSFRPGRGLPNEVITAILQAEECLDLDDLARCALVSRTFGKLAHAELYAEATISIEEAWGEGDYCWGFVDSDSLEVWQRLHRPEVAAATRSLEIRLHRGGRSGEQPAIHEDLSFDAPEHQSDGMWIYGCDVESLVAGLPKLSSLHIDWEQGAFSGDGDINVGRLETVRSLTLSRWQPETVGAAPHLADLSTGLQGGPSGTPYDPAPPVTRVCIHTIDSRLALAELRKRLEWATPPSLVSLSMPINTTSAAFVLPFLEESLPRWPDFRGFQLWGSVQAPRWKEDDWDALKALGAAHGFEVDGPGL